MAEVVGAVAAVVQFVDVALRLSSCLERFCSDVRNVPRRFIQLQIDLRQQIEIAQQIQNHRLPCFATAVASSTFDTPLAEYTDLAEELCKTLEGLLARQNDGVSRRGWDAICSVRKKEDVAGICDRLELKKSILSLWLEAANLQLASSIAATADQTRLDVSDTLTLAKAVDNTSNNIATNTAHLLPHIKQVDRTLATTSIRTERILENSQRLLTGYDADVLARESSHQSTAMILANTEQIIAAIEKLTVSPGKHDPHAQPGYFTDHMYDGFPIGQQVQRTTVIHGRRAQRCKCRTVSTARRWQPLSILRFTRTFRTQHFSYCPDYRISEQSLEVTMQIVLPSWLLYHTIDLGTKVRNWSTTSPFSISPIVIGTSRLVDSKTSPAFLAIKRTEKELNKLNRNLDRHRTIFSQLQSTLQLLFYNAEASALDTDRNGRPVLNEAVRLFVSDFLPICEVAEYVALFRFLLANGADPNTIKDAIPDHTFNSLTHYGGTICDQFMDPMSLYLNCGGPSIQELRTILKLFVDAGGHTSKPFVGDRDPGVRCTSFRNDITQLSLFEDQIDIMDLGDLVPIILQRQEEHFRRIIKKAEPSTLNRRSPINGLAPIHFAVLWPIGLRVLVGRGVDVNVEDNYGRRPIHLAVALGIFDSVRCLLDADCGLFTPAEDYSLLQYALKLNDNQKRSQISLQLTQAFGDRHTRIRNLAESCLPTSIFSRLGLAQLGLQEQLAPSITERLLLYGIHVPPALELDGKGFYNSFGSDGEEIQMTSDTADALWSVGFHDIDKPNENGWTPFLQSWFCHNYGMISWLTQRGVRSDSKHETSPLTALHLFAKGMGHLRTSSKRMSPLKEHCIELIQNELGIPYDDCTCACSPKGCSPTIFLLESEDYSAPPSQKDQIRAFIDDVNPPKSTLNQYIYHFTRHVLFDFLGGEHTCCSLGNSLLTSRGLQKPTRMNKWRKIFCGTSRIHREHLQCCTNGIPVPRMDGLRTLQDPDVFGETLESAMSHYDEMNRPDTMPLEEQVFEYIKWVLKERYLDIDVSNGCEHDDEVKEMFSTRG